MIGTNMSPAVLIYSAVTSFFLDTCALWDLLLLLLESPLLIIISNKSFPFTNRSNIGHHSNPTSWLLHLQHLQGYQFPVQISTEEYCLDSNPEPNMKLKCLQKQALVKEILYPSLVSQNPKQVWSQFNFLFKSLENLKFYIKTWTKTNWLEHGLNLRCLDFWLSGSKSNLAAICGCYLL